jgi:hypothetical protein
MKRRWLWSVVAATLIVVPTMASARPNAVHVQRIRALKPILDHRFPRTDAFATGAGAAVAMPGVTSFKAKVKDGKKTFTYVMVGKNPAKGLTNPSADIPTYLVPVSVVLPNGHTYDPTLTDMCDTALPAITRVEQSPMFASRTYSWGGTKVGTGQYIDAFRRAEFWKYTKRKGVSPDYHVNLSPVTTVDPITVNVPLADAAESVSAGPCGEFFGAIEINWWDNYVRTTLLPGLAGDGVDATTFPIFVLRNVIFYQNNTNNCCILGYHSAKNSASGIQTYGIADYDTGLFFKHTDDASVLAHEVGEWMDDPLGNNKTKPWGHIGQVLGCQGNLEVGDPLSGNEFKAQVNGYPYHVQQLAFFSWFYHQAPSLGVNGWYSNLGKFKGPAKSCH